jgi:hypothetical protein
MKKSSVFQRVQCPALAPVVAQTWRVSRLIDLRPKVNRSRLREALIAKAVEHLRVSLRLRSLRRSVKLRAS